ncbi:MAG TPA: iron-sulfur cluster assembly accessory protein [Gammaproteobacteria bacterium]
MITLTEKATRAVSRFIRSEKSAAGLRLRVTGGGCAGLQYEMQLESAPDTADTVVEQNNIKLFVDPQSAAMLEGLTIDFVDTMLESGFTFHNPNASASCGCGKSFSA